MELTGKASWVSKAVSWVTARLHSAFVWLQVSTRERQTNVLPTEGGVAGPTPPTGGPCAGGDEAPRRNSNPPREELVSCGDRQAEASQTAAPANELHERTEPALAEAADIQPAVDAGAQTADEVTHIGSLCSHPVSTLSAPAIGLLTGLVQSLPVGLQDHSRFDDLPGPANDCSEADAEQTPARPQEDGPGIAACLCPRNAGHVVVPPASAPAKTWPATREQAERLIALLAGGPVGCGSAGAEELTKLLDDEEFTRIVNLIAGSDRMFDDLRLPAAKRVYERIMAWPLGLREPVRFREPVHDLGILQMLYAALRDFAQTEGIPLMIPAAGVTLVGPNGDVVAHPAWWSCDALGQALKAPDPDLRAANGRVVARLFSRLAAGILEPALIATLASAPKPGRKAAVRSYATSSGARSGSRAEVRRSSGPQQTLARADVTLPEDPTIDAELIPGDDPVAGIWLRGHGTVAWTIRMAMSRGTRMLDAGELDRVRREVELAAWQRNLRRKVLAAVTLYIADPRAYDANAVRKRLRKDVDPTTHTPFALSDEQALFDAWRRVRHDADIPFDRSIGMPAVNVLAPEWIARIAPPFCAMLGVAPGDRWTSPEPVAVPQSCLLHDDAA